MNRWAYKVLGCGLIGLTGGGVGAMAGNSLGAVRVELTGDETVLLAGACGAVGAMIAGAFATDRRDRSARAQALTQATEQRCSRLISDTESRLARARR